MTEPDVFDVLLHPDKYVAVKDCECGHYHYEEVPSVPGSVGKEAADA